MGKIIFTVIMLIFSATKISGQIFVANYELRYKPLKNDSTTFVTDYNLVIDSQSRESMFVENAGSKDLNINVYKNYGKNEFFKLERIDIEWYKRSYDLIELKWKILNDVKYIAEYKCTKAEVDFGGRKWIAWYTSDVPFTDGPYKFGNLPGLIVEIESADGDYRFLLTSFKNDNRSIITKYAAIEFKDKVLEDAFKRNVIKDPAENYRRNMLSLKNNNIGVYVSYNGKEITDKDSEKFRVQSLKEWMSTHNNPIEKDNIWIK